MRAHDEQDELVTSKAWDHSLFRRLLGYALPHRGLFLGSFGVLFVMFALDLLSPLLWRKAIDGPLASGERATFWLYVGAYLGIVLIGMVVRYFEVAQLTRTGQAVIHDLRSHLFRHMQKLDLGFFDKQPTGSLVTRVTTDIENLNEMFTSGVVSLFFDLGKVVVVLAILFTIHWKLALVVLLLTPVLILLSLAFRGGARNAHRRVRARLAQLNGYLQEVLSGIRVVQIFQREERVSKRFAEHLDQYFAANKRTIFLFALFYPSMSAAVYLIQGVALWIAAHEMLAGDLTKGQFVQFWFYLAMLVRPIRELGERYNVLQSAFASAERIFQILDSKSRVASAKQAVRLAPSSAPAHVRFEGVHFGYRSDRPVVEDVSFEIAPGQTIAIVGATGAGKSTLASLLLRFYDPTRGRITFDGVDLREIFVGDLRARFGLVLQDDFLFAGTVRDNLVMERESVDTASLEEALQTSRAGRLVERLEGGLDAPVAERGVTFSTGERQLLAIARALAARPSIVVLDEATASVDSATEAQIETATSQLLSGRSALVIAHRLSTIVNADQILVMHRGTVRERGTHSELLQQDGLYARLHALQFAEHANARAV